MDFIARTQTEADADDLAEDICKHFGKFNVNISIKRHWVVENRIVFSIKTKGNTREAHMRANAPEVHAALDKAVAEKLILRILRNPANGCRLPPAKAREMQVLSPEEIQRLLIQAKEDGCYELLLLELSTGLRRGEICALQWNNLNLRTGDLRIERQVHRVKGELVVSPPKTKASNRSVILPAPVVGVLKTYKNRCCFRIP